MLIFKHGNIIQDFGCTENSVLMHGANCCNIMGAGIAKQIKDNFPAAYEVDRMVHENHSKKTGEVDVKKKGSFTMAAYSTSTNQFIINAYTQAKLGPNFDLKLFKKVLSHFNSNFFTSRDIETLMTPAIGCGIGKGDFNEVVKVIMDWYNINFQNDEIDVIVYFPH